jgi:hypothetical protein
MKMLVIGCGSIGMRHAQNARALGDVAVLEPDVTRRDKAAALGIDVFDELEPALDWGADGVVVATPHDSHMTLAASAIGHCRALLIEKPFGMKACEMDHVLADADLRGTSIYGVCNMRYHPALRILADHVGHVGKPIFGGGPDNPVHAPAGSAVGDYDRDGCPDVFLAGDPDAALYRNRCDGTFREVTTEAGLPRPYPAAATGAVFFDYDNDGWPDLFVAAVRGGHRLFRNRQGRFTDVSAAAGIPAGRWGSTVAVADYDRDGWLDVYVAAMGDHEHEVPDPSYAATNGVPNLLLHNRGDGTFAEVAEAAGVASTGWDLAAAWADYDGDAWPDLYVANEFGDNVLYRNEGDGTFTDRTDEAGVADGGAGMGVAWADYDADGDLDLFVSNMHANSGWALFHPDFPAPIPWRYRLLGLFTAEVQRRSDMFMDQLTRGSTLFRNDGDGGFTDVSDEAGVRDAQWGWAAEFLDYDHDGALDLYAVNGFITGPLLDDV